MNPAQHTHALYLHFTHSVLTSPTAYENALQSYGGLRMQDQPERGLTAKDAAQLCSGQVNDARQTLTCSCVGQFIGEDTGQAVQQVLRMQDDLGQSCSWVSAFSACA